MNARISGTARSKEAQESLTRMLETLAPYLPPQDVRPPERGACWSAESAEVVRSDALSRPAVTATCLK